MSQQEDNTAALIGEIEQGPSKFEQFLDRNQKNLIIALIALIVIVAAVIIAQGLQKNKALTSSAALVSASTPEELQGVADQFAGTAAGGSALIALGNAQWEAGDQESATQSLTHFLDNYADHAAYPVTLTNLGGKLAQMGKLDEAKQYLSEAAELEGSGLSAIANYLSAEIDFKAGDEAAALEQFKALAEQDDLGALTQLVTMATDSVTSPAPQVKQGDSTEE